ncbi:hypothetical protein PUR34_31010 [Streptomyces sp. JV185]|uniref:hypothetical protein n=1 Tax=Streptomyces sp. JV185 TaxID=858638 RepID=UPI002E7A804A|nr:hypothetical protein [Streptomyces sp. JV185]MEE1772473.1 hypothetical protein [Streptomyces sp. JV185]
MTVTDYLEMAGQADVLRDFEGSRFVADEQTDPVSGERRLLVTYCQAALATNADWWAALPRIAADLVDAPDAILVRLHHTDGAPPRPWIRHTSYLRHAGGPPVATPATSATSATSDMITVRRAVPGDEAALRRWVGQALVNGAAHGPAGTLGDTAEIAAGLLALPGRQSFVAERGTTAIGHATLLCAERDEVTGEAYVELFDVLVEADDEVRRAATDALTRACIRQATKAGAPLIGDVVHSVTDGGNGHGDRIVAKLITQGWSPDHALWYRQCGVSVS